MRIPEDGAALMVGTAARQNQRLGGPLMATLLARAKPYFRGDLFGCHAVHQYQIPPFASNKNPLDKYPCGGYSIASVHPVDTI